MCAGVLLSKEELERAAELTARAGAWLIMDNTYEHFVYKGLQHHCISAPHIIHLFSFSKVGRTPLKKQKAVYSFNASMLYKSVWITRLTKHSRKVYCQTGWQQWSSLCRGGCSIAILQLFDAGCRLRSLNGCRPLV
jgi:hypothetical protein